MKQDSKLQATKLSFFHFHAFILHTISLTLLVMSPRLNTMESLTKSTIIHQIHTLLKARRIKII